MFLFLSQLGIFVVQLALDNIGSLHQSGLECIQTSLSDLQGLVLGEMLRITDIAQKGSEVVCTLGLAGSLLLQISAILTANIP